MAKASSQIKSFSERASSLGQVRNLKMAGSAHAYVRGNTHKFYEWLAASDSSKVPQGPPIWICGDCHVGNLGPLADTGGQIDIKIRDLDQTVIGNPAHDLIRLGLSPALGDRMLGATFLDRGIFMRELLLEDLKVEIDQIGREEAMKAARYLAMVVGKARARQMDVVARAKWRDELGRNRSADLDAPNWLWSSIVELVGSHEAAYLAHCRKYALDLERTA